MTPASWAARTVGLLLIAAVAGAATVQGRLVNAAGGGPAPYVAVRLNSAQRGPSQFVYSGNDGTFVLRSVPPGSYDLEVWRNGRSASVIKVVVGEPVASLGSIRVP